MTVACLACFALCGRYCAAARRKPRQGVGLSIPIEIIVRFSAITFVGPMYFRRSNCSINIGDPFDINNDHFSSVRKGVVGVVENKRCHVKGGTAMRTLSSAPHGASAP